MIRVIIRIILIRIIMIRIIMIRITITIIVLMKMIVCGTEDGEEAIS